MKKKLHESEERYRFVAENAQDIITVTDANGTFLYVSPSIERILGYSPDELVGKKSVLDYLSSEDIERFTPKMKELAKTGDLAPLELHFLRKSGDLVWLESKISKVHDTPSEIRFITISRDITQRKGDHKERDLALAQAQLLLGKLSVVGGFVRHDIRDKLSVINNTLFLSKKYAKDDETMLQQLEQIAATTENISHILEFAQTLQAVGEQGLSWVRIGDTIKEAQGLFLALNGLHIDVSNVGFEVQADIALVEIFHNLIDNSLKYGQNLTQIKIYAEKSSDGSLRLVYEDNGGGIDSAFKPRLFQKGAGKGTGLGLYLIQRICDFYGWSVLENGQLGVGVRFELLIPEELTRPMV